MMPMLTPSLMLPRCPHCSVDKPNLALLQRAETNNHAGQNHRFWYIYGCARCGGPVVAGGPSHNGPALEIYPSVRNLAQVIPDRPRAYLQQAHDSLHAPAGAVMLAASAVDSMLKAKGYLNGSLYSRIETAVSENIITRDMGRWAHVVRLDANDQRHADDGADMPSQDDARRVLDFARALAEVMFVLPSRVERGLQEASPVG